MTQDDNPIDVPAIADAQAESKKSDAGLSDTQSDNDAETEKKPVPDDASKKSAEDDGGDDEHESEGDKKKPSRWQRLKRSVENLAAENAELRRRAEAGGQVDATEVEREVGKKPDESNFSDWFAYKDALDDWRLKKTLAEDRVRQRGEVSRQRQAETDRDMQEAFDAQLEDLSGKVEGFEKIMRKAVDIMVAPHVQSLIRESDKSGLLFLNLAQNPDKVDALNRMTANQAAREVGRIEAGLSLPSAKRSPKAPPPVTTPSGSASPGSASAEIDAFLRKTYGNRSGG